MSADKWLKRLTMDLPISHEEQDIAGADFDSLWIAIADQQDNPYIVCLSNPTCRYSQAGYARISGSASLPSGGEKHDQPTERDMRTARIPKEVETTTAFNAQFLRTSDENTAQELHAAVG